MGNQNNGDRNMNRRKLIKAVSASGAVGGLGAVGTVSADETSDGKSKIKKEEVECKSEISKQAVETQAADRLLETINNPDYYIDDSVRVNIYIDDVLAGYNIQVPTEYGSLEIVYNDSNITHARIVLNRENIPGSVRNKIISNINWPANVSGVLTYDLSSDTIKFQREVNNGEERRINNAINRSDTPVGIGAESLVNSSNSYYVVKYTDEVYYINKDSFNIESKEKITSGGITILDSCGTKSSLCLIDIAMASPHCTVGSLACGISGPATVGCVVAMLSFCLPNVALVAVSGNCSYVAKNC